MPPTPGRSTYKFASPETWELVRTAYMRGESAPSLAKRFNVTAWNIYKKAMEEGWSKRACALRDAREDGAREGLSPYSDADTEAGPPGETWTSLKDPPPPSMRRWPQPLPGMGPMRRPAWEPPPGYGPMPPHLAPPFPHPPEPSEQDVDPPSPAQAAEQAVAAAARVVAAGRYEEAERLGRLAATLQKLAGGAASAAKAKGPAAFHSVEDDEDAIDPDKLPLAERPFACTGATCLLDQERERAYGAVIKLRGERLKMDDCEDILAWSEMMVGLGARIEDEEVRRLAASLKAHGPGELHRQIDEVLGRPPRPGYIYNPLTPAPSRGVG